MNTPKQTVLLETILWEANAIQGLRYDNTPQQHENDTPQHRLLLATYHATNIKRALSQLKETKEAARLIDAGNERINPR